MWVWDKLNQKIVSRNIAFVPGLFKIFDEILVNAADNKVHKFMLTLDSRFLHGYSESIDRQGK